MIDGCSVSTRGGGERSARSVDQVLSTIAERQHGVVARRQLLACGISSRAVEGRLSRGQLHRIHRGVYAVGHRVLSVHGRCMAAVLACGKGAVLSHRSAAQLWQLLGRSSGAIEVTRASGWRAPAGVVVHRAPVPDDERTAIDGIPVTTMPRTILDLGTVASREQVERALNEAEILRLTDPLSVPHLLERYPRRAGAAVLREILGNEQALRGVAKNRFEERFAVLLDAHGRPRPRRNADLWTGGRHFNVDCLWEKERLIVELDGAAVHRTLKAFERDRERDRILLTAGYRTIRVTWRQVRDEPNSVVSDIRSALTNAKPASNPA